MGNALASVAGIVGAIGRPDFLATAAGTVRAFAGFDLAALFVHGSRESVALHDNFDLVGCRAGVERYARHTHCINPILAGRSARGVRRACDFRLGALDPSRPMHRHLIPATEEELGFRTLGWPERQEEIVLYFEGWGGLVELGLYRPRGRATASRATLAELAAMVDPLAAAFERHHALRPRAPRPDWRAPLTARERDVCELMLAGCSTEAIALRLRIAPFTVKDHRKRIFRKLRVGSLAELFARDRDTPPQGDGAHAALL